MISEIKDHPTHFSVLGILFSVSILAFILLSYSSLLQMMVVIFMATSYVLWGVFHHYLNRDLKMEIVLEYLIIAILVTVIFGALLFQ